MLVNGQVNRVWRHNEERFVKTIFMILSQVIERALKHRKLRKSIQSAVLGEGSKA